MTNSRAQRQCNTIGDKVSELERLRELLYEGSRADPLCYDRLQMDSIVVT